ncbi:MAG TPA: hypothetical protein VF702_08630 [Allosphingosinicella sp.]|jgi:hypothetical protein
MLGIALVFVGAFALWMMHMTGSIPHQWPLKWRHEDPAAFRRWRNFYVLLAGLGIVVFLIGLLRHP